MERGTVCLRECKTVLLTVTAVSTVPIVYFMVFLEAQL